MLPKRNLLRRPLIPMVCLLYMSPVAVTAQQDAKTQGVVSLEKAMTGATAMSVLAGAYLFIARPDGGYVCAININDRFFSSLVQGAEGNAFANQPGALCVTARMFDDLSRQDRDKL